MIESMLAPDRHDAEVAARFDAAEARFKPSVATDDVRLTALIGAIGPLDGKRLLDLGCGKGRFARRLVALGAVVVGIDLAGAMLVEARGIDRAKASARRLPFADAAFDGVFAVEVFEHVGDVRPVIREARRVLKAGGMLAIIDKNTLALDANRPWLPAVIVKWVDERRGLWMYPSGGPVRERWFVPHALSQTIGRHGFVTPRIEYLLTPRECRRWLHRSIPAARLMTLWTAIKAGESTDA